METEPLPNYRPKTKPKISPFWVSNLERSSFLKEIKVARVKRRSGTCDCTRQTSVCDFCNAPELFLDDHSEARIFCLDVANFLQTGKQTGKRGVSAMKSPIVKRSIVIAGHKTSVSLEDAFWEGLKEIAVERHMSLSDLVAAIDSERQHGNLSSAIRLFVLDFHRAQRSEERRNGAHEMISDTARAYS